MYTRSARLLAAAVVIGASSVVIWAGTRSGFEVQPHYSSGYTGVTKLGNGAGCSCHGSSSGVTTVAIMGPAALYPGQAGGYTVTVSNFTLSGSGLGVGINVDASDPSGLGLKSGQPTQISSGEITHTASRHVLSGSSVAYEFIYTMPNSASVSNTYTLAATAAIGFGQGWNHASNITITTTTPPNPASISTTAVGETSINLTWNGSSPEYRVIRKNGASATFTGPTDGAATLVYEGANTSATASGLTASTAYTFAVYGKASGVAVYSTGNQTVSATTGAAFVPTIYYVNATTGNDMNTGASGSPFKTITKAMDVALSGDTISVAAGTYDKALNELFPITLKSGVQLIGAGAASTIIDASGENAHVIEIYGGSSSTLLKGFTIKGGLHTGELGGVAFGGGIYADSGDQSTISHNIITNNEVRGYAGSESYRSGGIAYGGGIVVRYSSTTITNNIIDGNFATGGAGRTYFGTCDTGGSGGNGYGGGIYLLSSSNAIVANNTIVNNRARGGAGGSSTQNAGCGAGGPGGDGWAGGGTGEGVWVNNVFSNNTAAGGSGGSGNPQGADGAAYTGGLDTYSTPANCLFDANSPDDGTTGTNAVLSDPLFFDYANGDYRIPTASPAAGAGTSTNAPSDDFTGASRPSPPSIGAYEASKVETTTTLSSSGNPSTAGDSVTFTANVTSGTAGTITGTVTFKNGSETLGTANLTTGSGSYSTSALPEGSHSITAIYGGDSAYSSSTSSILTQVVEGAAFGPPENFSAKGTSTSQVTLSWNPVSGATSYEIYWSTGGSYGLLASLTGTTYNHTGRTPNTAYLYKVRAIGSETSAFTDPDVAVTIVFTDHPVSTSTSVKAAHFTELRTAVGAVRTAAGLGSYAFTNTISAGATIRAADITELRTALNEARSTLSLNAVAYTDPTVTAGSTTVKAAHVNELRGGVN